MVLGMMHGIHWPSTAATCCKRRRCELSPVYHWDNAAACTLTFVAAMLPACACGWSQVQRTHVDDEYAHAGEADPKVLVTTSREPSSRLVQFAKVRRAGARGS